MRPSHLVSRCCAALFGLNYSLQQYSLDEHHFFVFKLQDHGRFDIVQDTSTPIVQTNNQSYQTNYTNFFSRCISTSPLQQFPSRP
jgi:hypothetical protein